MGIAALILGIVSIIIGFIPLCGAIALLPALIGLILGIVDIVKKSKSNESKAMGITGTVLSALAMVIIFFWVFVFGATVSSSEFQDEFQRQLQNEINNLDSNNL